MLVLPMGLGTIPRRLPLVTLLLCLSWFWNWATDRTSEQISWRIFKAAAESGVRDRARDLFVDYCVAHHGDDKTCRRYAVLVWSGFPGQWRKPRIKHERLLINKNSTKDLQVIDVDFMELSREYRLAQSARKELEDCGTSRRCFRYKEILFNFLARHRSPSTDLAAYRTYQPFWQATRAYQQTLGAICRQFDCLIPGHVTYASVGWAQLRHGGFTHMFWNLILLLVFGVYVEQRLPRSVFLGFLVTGGMLGLAVQAYFFSSKDSLALGGSAIVCVAVGMFYVFFLRHRMAFWVWLPRRVYFGTRFKAPVLWCIPLMYVLSDVAGTVDSGFADLLADRVAHSAHLTGLCFGLAAAWLWKQVDPMPATYIYRGEMHDVKRLADSQDLREMMSMAERITASNPENIDAMEISIRKFLVWSAAGQPLGDKTLVARGHRYLINHMQTVLAVRTRQAQLPRTVDLLSGVSMDLPYITYLNQLGQTHILRIGDAALGMDQPMIALRLYDFFLQRFPATRKAMTVDRSASTVVAQLPADPKMIEAVTSFINTHPQSTLSPRLRAWLAKASAA